MCFSFFSLPLFNYRLSSLPATIHCSLYPQWKNSWSKQTFLLCILQKSTHGNNIEQIWLGLKRNLHSSFFTRTLFWDYPQLLSPTQQLWSPYTSSTEKRGLQRRLNILYSVVVASSKHNVNIMLLASIILNFFKLKVLFSRRKPFLKVKEEGRRKDYPQHQFRMRFSMAISEKLRRIFFKFMSPYMSKY